MAFRLKGSVVKSICTDQVQAIIKTPRQRYTEWTDESLQAYLAELGLDYTLEEIQIINDELHTRGVVEDV